MRISCASESTGFAIIRARVQVGTDRDEDARGPGAPILVFGRQQRQVRCDAGDFIAAVGAQAHAIGDAEAQLRMRQHDR